MTFKKLKNLIFGIAMFLLSGFYLYTAQHIKTRPKLTPGYASARIMPTLLGVLLAVLSVILIVESIIKLKKGTDDGKEEEKSDMLTVVLTFAAIIGYTLILKPLGFCLSTMLYLFVQMIILSPKEKRKIWLFAIIAVVFSMAVYFIFRLALSQILPRGILESLMGF